MNMITNYLNSLETYLPSDLKKDVREELENSICEQIHDKKEQLGRELNESEQEELLLEIGHPSRVASAYLPNQQLIGVDYFPAYKKSLEIALTVMLGLNLLVTVPFIFQTNNIIIAAITLFWDLFDTAIKVFSLVTIIFYLMQKYQANLEQLYAWSPKDIKEKNPKLSITRLDVFFELIFQVLFLVWWNGLFDLPLSLSDESIFTTVSFSGDWSMVFLPVNVIIAAGITISIHKLVSAGWSKRTLIGNMLLNFASLFVVYQISGFQDFVIFDNPLLDIQTLETLTSVIVQTTYSILGIIAVIILWDTWSNVKGLRNL